MRDTTVADLKANLAALLRRVQDGEEFTITKRGRPVALLTQPRDTGHTPRLGTLRGRIRFAPGWDAPLTDQELDEFAGDHP
jgi:prevent-host-death family protein